MEVIYLERICLRPCCLFLTAFEFWYISSHSILMWLRVLNISYILYDYNKCTQWRRKSIRFVAAFFFCIMILIIWVPFIIFCLRINCDDIYLFMFAKCFLYTNSACILWILLRFGIFRAHKCLFIYLYLCRLRSLDISNSLISFYRLFLLFPVYIYFWPTTTLLWFFPSVFDLSVVGFVSEQIKFNIRCW